MTSDSVPEIGVSAARQQHVLAQIMAQATENAARPAILEDHEKSTFALLVRQARRQAGWLEVNGLKAGNKVLLALPHGTALYRFTLALWYLGAIPVWADPREQGKAGLNACAAAEKYQAVVGTRKVQIWRLLGGPLGRIPRFIGAEYKELARKKKSEPFAFLPEDVALINFRVRPGGVSQRFIYTHGIVLARFQSLYEGETFSVEDVSYPFQVDYILYGLLSGISTVARGEVLERKQLPSRKLVALLIRQNITRLEGDLTNIYNLARYQVEYFQYKVGIYSVQLHARGVFPAEARMLGEGYPQAAIRIHFSLSESEPLTWLYAKDLAGIEAEAGLPAGRPGSDVQLCIIPLGYGGRAEINNEEWAKIGLPASTPGELIASAPHLYTGPWEPTDETQILKAKEKIWRRTGEAAYLDDQGQLFLLGPYKHSFTYKGSTYYPLVSEYFCSSLPQVSAGAIVLSNGRLTAWLESKPGNTEAERRLHEKFPDLDHISYSTSLPRLEEGGLRLDWDRL